MVRIGKLRNFDIFSIYRVKFNSDNSHSQDCQFEGMTFRILCMSDISISGFHYFEVSTFEWIDVKSSKLLVAPDFEN